MRQEIGGILAWAVKRCLEWQNHGLKMPEEVVKATLEYENEMDVINDFITECCDLGPNLAVSTKDIYEAFKEWCEKNEDRAMGKRALINRLREKGYTSVKLDRQGTRGWKGLNLL